MKQTNDEHEMAKGLLKDIDKDIESVYQQGRLSALKDVENMIDEFDFTNEFWKTSEKLKQSIAKLEKK